MKHRISRPDDTLRRLRTATKHVVRQRGIDSATISEIVRVAGLTSGSVYGKFESRDDLYLHVWDEGASAEIFELLERRLSTWREGSGGPDTQSKLVHGVEFGLQMLALSCRNDYLADTVRRDFGKFLQKHTALLVDDQIKTGETLILALELARLFYQGVRSDVDDWRLAREVFDTVLRDAETVTVSPSSTITPRQTSSNVENQNLVQSCRYVVGKVGIKNASLSRVARGAGVTTGAIFAQFDSREEFLQDAIKQLFSSAATRVDRKVVEAQSRQLLAVALGSLLTTSSDPQQREWNAFRTECFLSARSMPFIRSALRAILSSGRYRYEELLLPAWGFDPRFLGGVTVVGQSLPIGLHILDSLEPSVSQLSQSESVCRLLDTIGVVEDRPPFASPKGK